MLPLLKSSSVLLLLSLVEPRPPGRLRLVHWYFSLSGRRGAHTVPLKSAGGAQPTSQFMLTDSEKFSLTKTVSDSLPF